VSSSGSEEVKLSELQRELMEAQDEAAATKEELNSCRESLEKLQELLQVQSQLDLHCPVLSLLLSSVKSTCTAFIAEKKILFFMFLHLFINKLSFYTSPEIDTYIYFCKCICLILTFLLRVG